MRKAGKAETDLTRQVREALEKLGVYVERMNSGTARGGRTKLARKGSPDLIGRFPAWHRWRGIMFAIETKASHRDTCSCESCTAQRKWAWEHARDGGVYVKARSVWDAVDGLGLPAPLRAGALP